MKKSIVLLLILFISVLKAVSVGYDISLDQIKDSRTLLNSISLVHQLTSRITMNANASFSAKKEKGNQSFTENRNGSASVTFRPGSGLEFGINLSRNISTKESYGTLIKDQLENTTSGQIRYSPTSWLSIDMKLGAHFVDYMNPSGDSTITGHDQGGVSDVDISLSKNIFSTLNANITFGEERRNGDKIDKGTDQLTARLSYGFPQVFNGGNLTAQAGASSQFSVYHDSANCMWQDNWYSDLTFVIPSPFEYLSMEITTGWDYMDHFWEEDDPDTSSSEGDVRDRLDRKRSISSSLRYQIIDDLELTMSLSRSLNRNDRKRTATGVSTLFDVYDISDNRVFSSNLQYTPGDSRITFERLIQLSKSDTYGEWTDGFGNEYRDNNDYDILREALSLSAEIPLSSKVTLDASIQGQSRKTVYLMAEQSANSKISSTYSFNPGFRYFPGGSWTLQETIKISADYTTFLFPEVKAEGSDLLFRRLVSTTSFMRVSEDSTTLGVSNTFDFRDQGSFDNSVFSRSEEIINNTITLNMGFHISEKIGLTPNYSWEYSQRNYLASGNPSLIDHMHHVGLRTRMNLNNGILSLRVTRTFYSDDRPSYWKADVGLNYQF
ncbi:MAG: hypothetical protein K8R76_10100 [Candidatus Aegiribacteria sp.]|nr:hypothetical protein [Candidatus Aegiribacteria sp.]